MRLRTTVLASLLLLPSSSPAVEDWDFVIAPYLLLPSISGDAEIGNNEGSIDVDAGDILESLELGAMIHLEASHASGFGAVLDYSFMLLGDDATGPAGLANFDVDIFQGVLEALGTYRIATAAGPVDTFVGIRWWDIDADVDFSVDRGKRSFSNGASWVDPVLGARWTPQIAENWHLILRGDIGGFGAGSEFSWNVQGGIRWDATDCFSLVLEYRALDVDYDKGTPGTAGRFSYNTLTQGPMLGFAFRL